MELLLGTEIHAHGPRYEVARKVVTWRQAPLLTGSPRTSSRWRRLVDPTFRNFIFERDADADNDSPVGFDDDALVVEAVARQVGLADVVHRDGFSR